MGLEHVAKYRFLMSHDQRARPGKADRARTAQVLPKLGGQLRRNRFPKRLGFGAVAAQIANVVHGRLVELLGFVGTGDPQHAVAKSALLTTSMRVPPLHSIICKHKTVRDSEGTGHDDGIRVGPRPALRDSSTTNATAAICLHRCDFVSMCRGGREFDRRQARRRQSAGRRLGNRNRSPTRGRPSV